MSYNTCHNKGHNKRKCPLGAPTSGISFTVGPSSRPATGPSSVPLSGPAAPSSRPLSGPAATPTSTQTVGPAATPTSTQIVGQEQHLMLQLEEEGVDQRGSVASRTRMVGMPGMPSERFRNVKSSAVVTGDLGHKPPCGVKWKGKKAMTSSQLEDMRGRKQMETRSKAAHLSQESSNAI
ncbi:hypothetical protein KY290_024772 [Solanum tuberosum]|uniref:Uncharacterized protein n=1 Tax=Solanum tuberosum TaxID=4113 RepID=A0ABQ7URM0_SOLTU|nr:hypothetical protein KY284_023628 [Solanum tuberosum]KAH0754502.1 hypothetical protein KY290_024772 [Solanum tuberosum]